MVAENDDIKKAIQVAEQEYNSLLDSLKEYERIKLRLSQLEVFINTGKNLLGHDVTTINGVTISTKEPVMVRTRTLFPDENIQSANNVELIKKILTDTGRALTLADLVEEYNKRNWKLSEKNGTEVLRSIINREENVFKKEIIKNKTYVSLIG
jgi:hypothetical protein